MTPSLYSQAIQNRQIKKFQRKPIIYSTSRLESFFKRILKCEEELQEKFNKYNKNNMEELKQIAGEEYCKAKECNSTNHVCLNTSLRQFLGYFMEDLIVYAVVLNRLYQYIDKDEFLIESRNSIFNMCEILSDIYKTECIDYGNSSRLYRTITNFWWDEYNNLDENIRSEYQIDIGSDVAFEVPNTYKYFGKTGSIKQQQLKMYIEDSFLRNKFKGILESTMRCSISRTLQNEYLFNGCFKKIKGYENIIEYFKRCIFYCFGLINEDKIDIWLEYMIQFRFTPIGDELNDDFKNNLLDHNVVFKPQFNDDDFTKTSGEIDIISRNILCEIKFHAHFDKYNVERILNKSILYAGEESNIQRDRICGIDALGCQIFISSPTSKQSSFKHLFSRFYYPSVLSPSSLSTKIFEHINLFKYINKSKHTSSSNNRFNHLLSKFFNK